MSLQRFHMEEIKLQRDGMITIQRDSAGIPHVHATTNGDLFFAQGYMQYMDRSSQMLLGRITGEGRLSELIEATDSSLHSDIFFRRINSRGDAPHVIAELPVETRKLAFAYCDGINHAMSGYIPHEFRFINHHPQPWRMEDSLMFMRLMNYLASHQNQLSFKYTLIKMARTGYSDAHLEAFSRGNIKGLDDSLISSVGMENAFFDILSLPQVSFLPILFSANSVMINGKRSETGKAMLAYDVHTIMNRLPAAWQPIVLHGESRYMMGMSIPGIPGIISGRNNDAFWNLSLSHADTIDLWVEECREGKCRRSSKTKTEWARFFERYETIRRKNRKNYTVTFFENEHGVLMGNPFRAGRYLTERWSGNRNAGAGAITAMFGLMNCQSVEELSALVNGVEFSWLWSLGDACENIAIQQSGWIPKRKQENVTSFPFPGWDGQYDWKGFYPAKSLFHKSNPRDRYLVSADNALPVLTKNGMDQSGYSSYRYERLNDLVKNSRKVNITELASWQYDDLSYQAEEYLRNIGNDLPDTEQGVILKNWDCHYSYRSRGAFLFEKFLDELHREIFEQNPSQINGKDLVSESFRLSHFERLDRILLSQYSPWFRDGNRDQLVRSVASRILSSSLKSWGGSNRFFLRNSLLSKKLPRFLRVDRGDYVLSGSRASVLMTQFANSSGTRYFVAPSFRIICDLSSPGIMFNMSGGAIDRPFSFFYNNLTEKWLHQNYIEMLP